MVIALKEKRVAIQTLGCRLNFAESGSMAKEFVERGYKICDFGEEVDLVVINTCTVTDGADSNCRNVIRKGRRSSPEAKIVVVGCYAQMESEEAAKIDGVDLILGTSEKYKLFEYLDCSEADGENQLIRVEKDNTFYPAATTKEDFHTRAFLKVQDGCSYVCSYCVIPFARGRSRAGSIESCVNEAKKLVDSGFKEVVITGVNIGDYESGSGEPFENLVQEILGLEGLSRLRLSSIEPNTISDQLLEILQGSEKFMDHFHIPLQSGDSEILKMMRRRYSLEQYQAVVEKIRRFFPQAGIGVDVIVGHPGETQQLFQNTYDFLESLPVTHFHIFPYSKRKKTTAASMDGHVDPKVKKERAQMLTALGKRKQREFAQQMIGQQSSVLFERAKNGYWEGYSSNFLRVKVADGGENLENQIRQVQFEKLEEDLLIGALA